MTNQSKPLPTFEIQLLRGTTAEARAAVVYGLPDKPGEEFARPMGETEITALLAAMPAEQRARALLALPEEVADGIYWDLSARHDGAYAKAIARAEAAESALRSMTIQRDALCEKLNEYIDKTKDAEQDERFAREALSAANREVDTLRATVERVEALLRELEAKRHSPADDADHRGLTWRVHAEQWDAISSILATLPKGTKET